MNKPTTSTTLTYIDHDGARREVKGCHMTVDASGRHWIWSDQLGYNLVYKTEEREYALLAAIDSLLFSLKLRDERTAELQRIVNLATEFADKIKPDDDTTN